MASLKHRLELYYSFVSPETPTASDWPSKFTEIYRKFGCSLANEIKLQAKLKKKYGDEIVLNIPTVDAARPNSTRPKVITPKAPKTFIPDPSRLQITTGNTSFTSSTFDAYACLLAPPSLILTSPPLGETLDNVDRCRRLLPETDCWYLPPTKRKSGKGNEPEKKRGKKEEDIDEMAKELAKGPYSVLYNAMKSKRPVVIVIRYVDCIRGEVTGVVQAFDKHFNVALGRSKEVYAERGMWAAGERKVRVMPGIFVVRGDMIVAVKMKLES